jgi:hypothetical protein
MYFKLVGADGQSRRVDLDVLVVGSTQFNQVTTVAPEDLAVSLKGKSAEEPSDFLHVIWIIRRDQQVHVDGRAPAGADAITHLYVRKD